MKSETEKALVEMVRVAYRQMTGESPDDLVITICQRGRPNGTAFEINTTRVGRCLCCVLWLRQSLPERVSGPGLSPADHQWHQMNGKRIIEAMQAEGLYAKKTYWRGVNVVNMLREAAEL